MPNSRSTLMADLLSKPVVMGKPQLSHGRLRCKITEVVLDNTEAAGHLVPLCRLKSTDKILKVEIANPAIAGATDVNVGLWTAVDWTLADGVAKDADIIIDGITLGTAHIGYFDYAGAAAAGAGARTAAQMDRLVWEDAGDTTAPITGTQYDLVMQFVADPGAAATIGVCVYYLAGD